MTDWHPDSQADLAERIKVAIRTTYDAAADHFDDGPLSLWDHLGLRTVELAGVQAGDAVLDVCCGTGASALAAAERVGSQGHVIGVDFAERLLERARARAQARGLDNVEFVAGDLTSLERTDGPFDVVVCAFGVFFAPDSADAMARLWRAVGPGGKLAVSTWGRRLFEPGSTMFWDAVEAERSDLRPARQPYAPMSDPAGLSRLFTEAGAPAPEIDEETVVQSAGPSDFWTLVLGSGYRLPIDLMGADAASRVRAALQQRMAREPATDTVTDVLYARARRD